MTRANDRHIARQQAKAQPVRARAVWGRVTVESVSVHCPGCNKPAAPIVEPGVHAHLRKGKDVECKCSCGQKLIIFESRILA